VSLAINDQFRMHAPEGFRYVAVPADRAMRLHDVLLEAFYRKDIGSWQSAAE
jgi:hypothetical protein